jgi:hypothetical protein
MVTRFGYLVELKGSATRGFLVLHAALPADAAMQSFRDSWVPRIDGIQVEKGLQHLHVPAIAHRVVQPRLALQSSGKRYQVQQSLAMVQEFLKPLDQPIFCVEKTPKALKSTDQLGM